MFIVIQKPNSNKVFLSYLQVIDGLCIPYPIYRVFNFQFNFLLVCSSAILLLRLLMDRASLSNLAL